MSPTGLCIILSQFTCVGIWIWVIWVGVWKYRTLKPNTHRRRRWDETVESHRVGGVYTNSQLVGDSLVVSSVWTHPSAVVNWVTADSCVVRSHRRIRRQSSRIHVHTADATRQNSFVLSASAVCIAHKHHVLSCPGCSCLLANHCPLSCIGVFYRSWEHYISKKVSLI